MGPRTRVNVHKAAGHLPVPRAAGKGWRRMGCRNWDIESSHDHRFVFTFLSGEDPEIHIFLEPDETEITPSSPITNPEPILDPLVEQIQDFLGIGRPAVTPTPAVIPTLSLIPFPVAVLSPVPPPQIPPQGPPNAKPSRWKEIQKFLGSFRRRLWAKFIRASREPVTLSRGLVPEREENGEVFGARYGELF